MIPIKDAEQFANLIKALSDDVVDAHIHYRLHIELGDALRKYHLVGHQSPVFWQMTLLAHLHACIHTLCRVFDQENKSLHLRSWLLTIKENLHLFDDANFRLRLKGNPFVDSLAAEPRKPDEVQLEYDINQCSIEDPDVRTLMIHRGSRLAHRSAKNAVSGRDIGATYPLTHPAVETLLERSRALLNRYSHLFSANLYSTTIVGHDDYDYVLESVQLRVEASRREFEELRAKYSEP